MVRLLLQVDVVVVVLGKTSRMVAIMSGKLSFINESVLRRLIDTGMVFARVVLGIFLFPFHLEELVVEIIAG